MIEIKNLTKRFGDSLVVDHLSLIVNQGEVLGFLGPNGAGKTTTLRVIAGFFPPTSGFAKIAGFNVLTESLKARQAIGYLPENVPLYINMRVKEYLRFVAKAKGLTSQQILAEVDRVLHTVGITECSGQLIKQLSKGFRQRIGLAQALLGDPPVLILDEPTIGLDPGQLVEIRALIKKFIGIKTVLLSSHILPEIAATCSRVAIINQGRLVIEGPPAILSSEITSGCLVRLVALAPSQELLAIVKQVDGVISAQLQTTPNNQKEICILQLHINNSLDIKADLAKVIVQSGYHLIELTPITASLEEIFVKLITEEKNYGRKESTT